MNDELCLEKHRRIDENLEVHTTRLNNHADRIDKLEQYQSATNTKIENLCEQIKSLVGTMKWFIGLLVGSFVGFFFYAVQRNIFK
jgi:guanylate kinase